MVEKPLHTVRCSADMGIYYHVTIVFFLRFKASTSPSPIVLDYIYLLLLWLSNQSRNSYLLDYKVFEIWNSLTPEVQIVTMIWIKYTHDCICAQDQIPIPLLCSWYFTRLYKWPNCEIVLEIHQIYDTRYILRTSALHPLVSAHLSHNYTRPGILVKERIFTYLLYRVDSLGNSHPYVLTIDVGKVGSRLHFYNVLPRWESGSNSFSFVYFINLVSSHFQPLQCSIVFTYFKMVTMF